jgi:hypothetical protein
MDKPLMMIVKGFGVRITGCDERMRRSPLPVRRKESIMFESSSMHSGRASALL